MLIFHEFTDKKIALLMGGKSAEREVSLRSGKRILSAMEELGISAIAVDPINEDWLDRLTSAKIDILFLGLHGRGAEDGTIQGVLEAFQFPYTGSGILASAIAMNKLMAKRIFIATSVPTSEFFPIDGNNPIAAQSEIALKRLGLPIVVKPTSEGSSIGVTIVDRASELEEVVAETVKNFGETFLEKYVDGTEITIGLIGSGENLRALPILELVPKHQFYDYKAKYTDGLTEFIIPARLPEETTKLAQKVAIEAHRAIGCHGVSRVDLMVDLSGNPYVMEINTLPGLTELSDLPAQAAADGISYNQLILEILRSALTK